MFLDLVMDIFENILNAYLYCEPVSCRAVTACASGSLYLKVQELFWATHPKILCQDFQVFFQHSDPSVLLHSVFILLLLSSLPW